MGKCQIRMKKIVLITAITFLTLSCSTKWRMIDKTLTNEGKTISIANKLFENYKEDIHLDHTVLDRTHLINGKEYVYLRRNIKVHNLYLLYDVDSTESIDSVVIFSRNTFTRQHLLIVDMRKGPRYVMPTGFKRISDRIYYCQRQGELTKTGYKYN
jgi:hypothetical protein